MDSVYVVVPCLCVLHVVFTISGGLLISSVIFIYGFELGSD